MSTPQAECCVNEYTPLENLLDSYSHSLPKRFCGSGTPLLFTIILALQPEYSSQFAKFGVWTYNH